MPISISIYGIFGMILLLIIGLVKLVGLAASSFHKK